MSTTASNTPIKELIAEYQAEQCDFQDLNWVAQAAARYVETMEDSQVRCLLHTLANAVIKHVPEEKRNPPKQVNQNIAAIRIYVDEALQAAGSEISAAFGARDVDIKLRSLLRSRKYKDGGRSTKLFIELKAPFQSNVDFRQIIHRKINERLTQYGLPKVLMYTTSGSQNNFYARLVVKGDEDYERCKNYSWYNYE